MSDSASTVAKRPKYGGRKAGTPNKISRTVLEAIDEAFFELGGADYLVDVAKANPQAFCALLGKRLPKDLTNHHDGTLTLKIVTGVAHE